MVIVELPRIPPTCSNPALIFTTICDWLSFYLVLLTYIVDFLCTSLFSVSLFSFSFFVIILAISGVTHSTSLFYHFCCCRLVAKLCPTLLWPEGLQFAGSSVPGISQTGILEWVVISFSKGSSWPRDQTLFSALAGGLFTTEPPGKSLSFTVLLSRKDSWCWCTYAPSWHQWKGTCLPMQET